MGKPIIKICDAVHCKANKHARPLILKSLAYKEVVMKRGKYGKREQQVVKSHLITGRKGTAGHFLTGLLPRVVEKTKHKIIVTGSEEELLATGRPTVKGITFRPDQKKALRAVKKNNRGIIVFPTGSGKTIIALGITSMFKKSRHLFLVHTTDLLNQSYEEYGKRFKNVWVLGGGHKGFNWDEIKKSKYPIVISTVQSFSKFDPSEYIDFFDITIVDEVHHVNAKNSQYGKIMQHNLSPRRYGLTATVPTSQKESLVNEGFFGKKIAELSLEEGIKLGIIAKPKLSLISVPYNPQINVKCSSFKDYYDKAIVANRVRNDLTVKAAMRSMKKDKIVLIIIERKEHGKRLKKLFKRNHLRVPFVFGDTKPARRNKIKNKLKSGELKCAICSKVWKEGINIPSLNHIIYAVGLKEEKAVLQGIGRGLRTTEDKDIIQLTDFLDPYRFLAEHSIKRLHVYNSRGWV